MVDWKTSSALVHYQVMDTGSSLSTNHGSVLEKDLWNLNTSRSKWV